MTGIVWWFGENLTRTVPFDPEPISNIPQKQEERSMNLSTRYSGFRLIESLMMVKHVQRSVRRIWTERLFSRPWRPWVREKVVVDVVPLEKVAIDYVDRVVIGHPDIIRIFKRQLQEARGGVCCN